VLLALHQDRDQVLRDRAEHVVLRLEHLADALRRISAKHASVPNKDSIKAALLELAQHARTRPAKGVGRSTRDLRA
jgi:hypothetical protein